MVCLSRIRIGSIGDMGCQLLASVGTVKLITICWELLISVSRTGRLLTGAEKPQLIIVARKGNEVASAARTVGNTASSRASL